MNREGNATYESVGYGGGGNGGGSVATSSPLVQQQAERQPNFNNIAHVKVELPSPSPTSATSSPSPPSSQPPAVATAPLTLTPSSLLTQMNALGPTDRCTPSQAQAMGQQVLAVIALHEKNTLQLPFELQNSFDVFHRCLAVVFGTFFLNLYTKANAPCLLCHGCKSLYPPGQFIHHICPALPTTIVPCRSRMWRRCLVPLVSPGVDKLQQKQRWKFVLEKFSHNNHRKNPIPAIADAQILEMPECKRGRFVAQPTHGEQGKKRRENEGGEEEEEDEEGADRSMEEEGEQEVTERVAGRPILMHANHSNLLDVEPVDCDEEDCTLESLATMDSTIPCPPKTLSSPSPPPPSHPQGANLSLKTSVVGLAEQLVMEVRRLTQDLSHTKAKLSTAELMIQKMPSEACMREQLAQALAVQQQLSLERDQALEQARLARERADLLQQQLARIRSTHNEMERHITGLP